MSGERPSPLWPEGLRKERNLPPVESQRRQAPASGDISLMPKQEAVSGGKKPEEPKQQPSDPNREAFERFLSKGPMRPAVFGGHERPSRRRRDNTQLPEKPGQQRGAAEPSQPNPAEQQAAERLGKPPPQEPDEETLDPEVEEAIRQYGIAVGDPEEAAQLREQAKNDPAIREFFKRGPISLTSSSLDLSILRKPEDIS